ncbi:MAG: hypothetical protein COB46_13720 [Rhodospirillaceae bacterium]|nr:MAG: hypothetical protein COB46_13720 [Rhodospirillaceae bacterium]
MKKDTNIQNIAWEFLKLNPEYNADYKSNASRPKRLNNTFSLTIHRQLTSDLSANKWGLLAYENPSNLTAPFWSIAPTLEAEVSAHDEPALLPMLHNVGSTASGLLLLNGDLILKIENAVSAIQVRIKNGHLFKNTSGLVLRLPINHQLPLQLSHGLELFNVVTGQQAKKIATATKRIMSNFFLSLSISSQVATNVR